MDGDWETDTVVITGCGWMTPFSAGSIDEVLTKTRQVQKAGWPRGTGSADTTRPSASGRPILWTIAEERLSEYPALSKELQRDKGGWITAVAFEHACADAGIGLNSLDSTRVGLVLGCGLAGQVGMITFANEVRQQSARFVSPIHFPQTVGNYIAGALARAYDIRGPNMTLASGSASGLEAIIEACSLLTSAQADVVLAGGTELLTDDLAAGFGESDVALGEGACLFVLELANHAAVRGAPVVAAVRAWKHMPATPGEHQTYTDDPETSKGRPSTGSITSVAGVRQVSAICIEHWIGRCFGALGAAAAAAAIGAARQHDVPVIDSIDSSGPGAMSARSFPIEELRGQDGTVRATIIADADGALQTVLELTISGAA